MNAPADSAGARIDCGALERQATPEPAVSLRRTG